MKHALIITCLFIIALANTKVNAQSCSGSALFTQGKQFVYLTERPDIRGGVNQAPKQIKAAYVVKTVSNAGGVTTATYDVVKWEDSSDPNAKPPTSGTYRGGICNGSSIMFIARVSMGPTVLDDTTEFPMNMKVGDKMKDKTITFSIPGKTPITVSTLKQTSVVGQENITTPAGTWDCFKIAIATITNLPAMGSMPANTMTNTSYMWFAPSIGLVKSQITAAITSTLISIQ